ncbi:sporulation kinase [hydrocarbon metagenome]|uniref:histidine kinase n=1 Tax=hydrocarbon metagenome TaxID=938273 RepID=A0A0W8E5Q0_9ZZZZ
MAIIRKRDQVCLDANRSFLINTGYSREEVVGHNIKELKLWTEPEDREKIYNSLQEKSVQSLELSYTSKSGEKRYGLAYKEDLVIDEECYLGVMVDITDFRVVKETLEVKEEMYRQIVETAHEGIWLVDADYRTTFVNQKMAAMLGYTVEEMNGKSLNHFVDDHWRAITKEYSVIPRRGSDEPYQYKLQKKDGGELWALISQSPFFDRDGSWSGSLGMIVDITHHKEAEKALSESNRRLADILNFLPDATLVIDCKGRVIAWNKAAEEMTGIKSQDILGKGDYEYSIPFYGYRRPILVDHVLNYEQDWGPNYSRIDIKGKVVIGENLCRTIDNTQAYLWAIATPLYDMQGNITGAIESIRDITDRRRAENDLKASEEQYRRIVETANEGIWLNDHADKITFVNEKLADMLGYSVDSIIGCSLFTYIARDHRRMACIMMERNRKGIRVEHDLKFRCRDGSSLWAVVSMSPIFSPLKKYIGSLAMISDVTERKKLEMQMARLDRLNLVGQIAACIGHEIRNPMTSVRGFLQIMAGDELYNQDKEHFDLMIEELDRANAIITEFLSLAKNKAIELKLHNLNSIVKGIFPLINAEALAQDKIAHVHLEEIPQLLLDESEIRQLLLNLARNALEAMPSEKGLMIKTLREGAEVILLVQDQGSGIHPDILGEIGTPFITTKEEGTGLGLPVCYSIAARHDAAIEVESGAGGTTFFVRFKIPTGI